MEAVSSAGHCSECFWGTRKKSGRTFSIMSWHCYVPWRRWQLSVWLCHKHCDIQSLSRCDMKNIVAVMIAFNAAVMPVGEGQWYVGDERCPPPKDDGSYSAPYSAIDHQYDYPIFNGADKPGW